MTDRPSVASIVRQRQRLRFGKQAVIKRGNDWSDPITLTMGQVDSVVMNSGETRFESQAQDLFISASDYVIAGQTTDPADGDRVTVTMNGVSVDYDVRSLDGSECFNYSDPERTEMRVHTKCVQSLRQDV